VLSATGLGALLVAEHRARSRRRIVGPPALVVEAASAGSRRYDAITKRDDYERFGVAEYWPVDPEPDVVTFHRLEDGQYVVVAPEGDRFASRAVPGFVLDLAAVRRLFEP
jgi:Uma2 family endonuclease